MNNDPARNKGPISQFAQMFSSTPVKPPAPFKKQRMLVWSDSAAVTTGFGVVSKNILAALHTTGKYEIDQLAINQPTNFQDKDKYPYNMIPARLNNPQDPFGNQMLANAVQAKDYDIIFIINDMFVVHQAADYLKKIQDAKAAAGRTVFNIVYYYPVDCRYMPAGGDMVKLADISVAYTRFGAVETQKHLKNKPNAIIYHGTDTVAFHKIGEEQRQQVRSRYLGVRDPETFVLVSVNRNSIRKDMARTILAFSEFRKQVPNSLLYLHARIIDGTGGYQLDLGVTLEDLGLSMQKDVIFPTKYASSRGFPTEVLNQFYNAGDAFLTTNLGEGWGLTLTEAMAAGVPVITPNHSTAPEIFGDDRGYLIPCKERVYVDNSGYRPWCQMDDIVEQMMLCYDGWKNNTEEHQNKIKLARAFTEQYSWDNVCKQWIKLFNKLKPKDTGISGDVEGEVV